MDRKLKVLISSCLLGNNVRWNGLNKKSKSILKWAEDNNIDLLPVCPENELFGTPRPIRLIELYGKIQAMMKGQDVMVALDEKCQEIFDRYPGAVGSVSYTHLTLPTTERV